jgi:VanZ family protein
MINRTQLIRMTLVCALTMVTFFATVPLEALKLLPDNDKLIHVIIFFILAVLVDYSFHESSFGFYKILFLMIFGLLIEVIQYFIPSKHFSLYDLAADCIGVALFWLIMLISKTFINRQAN